MVDWLVDFVAFLGCVGGVGAAGREDSAVCRFDLFIVLGIIKTNQNKKGTPFLDFSPQHLHDSKTDSRGADLVGRLVGVELIKIVVREGPVVPRGEDGVEPREAPEGEEAGVGLGERGMRAAAGVGAGVLGFFVVGEEGGGEPSSSIVGGCLIGVGWVGGSVELEWVVVGETDVC